VVWGAWGLGCLGVALTGVGGLQADKIGALLKSGLNAGMLHAWVLLMHRAIIHSGLGDGYSQRALLREHGLKVLAASTVCIRGVTIDGVVLAGHSAASIAQPPCQACH
jgi:hypothetical protein